MEKVVGAVIASILFSLLLWVVNAYKAYRERVKLEAEAKKRLAEERAREEELKRQKAEEERKRLAEERAREEELKRQKAEEEKRLAEGHAREEEQIRGVSVEDGTNLLSDNSAPSIGIEAHAKADLDNLLQKLSIDMETVEAIFQMSANTEEACAIALGRAEPELMPYVMDVINERIIPTLEKIKRPLGDSGMRAILELEQEWLEFDISLFSISPQDFLAYPLANEILRQARERKEAKSL